MNLRPRKAARLAKKRRIFQMHPLRREGHGLGGRRVLHQRRRHGNPLGLGRHHRVPCLQHLQVPTEPPQLSHVHLVRRQVGRKQRDCIEAIGRGRFGRQAIGGKRPIACTIQPCDRFAKGVRLQHVLQRPRKLLVGALPILRLRLDATYAQILECVALEDHATVEYDFLLLPNDLLRRRPLLPNDGAVPPQLVRVQRSQDVRINIVADRPKLEKIPDENNLDATEGQIALANMADLRLKVIEELPRNHRYLVDNENLHFQPYRFHLRHLFEIRDDSRHARAHQAVQCHATRQDGRGPCGRGYSHEFIELIAILPP
mmetsp:Transcript_26276/g.73507  ORF Transcript_26276/g.73507 Transcript_26276/m.73507 type:complete len:315 (-) Transcript_26276:520-1464(-)